MDNPHVELFEANTAFWTISVGSAAKSLITAVLALCVFHILRRKLLDRQMRLDGLPPSWWNPLGVEIELVRLMTKQRQGEALINFIGYYTKLYKHLGIFRGWALHVPIVAVIGPEAIEFILASNSIIKKAFVYDFLHSWLGTGLLTSTGSKWHSRRKMITPAFHFRILDDFLSVFNEHARTLTEKIIKMDEKPFNISSHAANCALDIICETAMGIRIDAQSNEESEYVKTVHRVGNSFIQRAPRFWLWPNFIYNLSAEGRQLNKDVKFLHNFTKKVINERRSQLLASSYNKNIEPSANDVCGQKIRKPFLNLLLENHLNGGGLSLADIQEEVDTFMFEGHDTTAVGISWAIFLLAENQQAQRKVQQELDEIFGGDVERNATSEDLANMKYLEYCIKESQRLFPSVPVIGRDVVKTVEYNKSVIPAGSLVIIPIYHIHRDENIYPSPEEFIPERFLPENCEKRHPFSYIPFSAGPRNCIGQKFAMNEEKIVISWILRRLSISTSVRRENLRILGELVTRSADTLLITAKQR